MTSPLLCMFKRAILCIPTIATQWVCKGRKPTGKTGGRGSEGKRWNWSLFSRVLLPHLFSHFLFFPVRPFLRNGSWGILCWEIRSMCSCNLCQQLRSALTILQIKVKLLPGDHRWSTHLEMLRFFSPEGWMPKEGMNGCQVWRMCVQWVGGAQQTTRSTFPLLKQEKVLPSWVLSPLH